MQCVLGPLSNIVSKTQEWKDRYSCRFNEKDRPVMLPFIHGSSPNEIISSENDQLVCDNEDIEISLVGYSMFEVNIYNEYELVSFFASNAVANYEELIKFLNKYSPKKTSRYVEGYRIYDSNGSVYQLCTYQGMIVTEFAFEVL